MTTDDPFAAPGASPQDPFTAPDGPPATGPWGEPLPPGNSPYVPPPVDAGPGPYAGAASGPGTSGPPAYGPGAYGPPAYRPPAYGPLAYGPPVYGPPPGAPGAWGPPGAWPQAGWPPAYRRTTGWAIVALVTGVTGLVPVALVTGIVALVVLRSDRTRSGQGLAVGGLAAAGAWLLVGAAVFAAVAVFEDSGLYGVGRLADAGATTVGSCLEEPDDEGRWAPTSCGGRHEAEVSLVDELSGSTWPGTEQVDARADDRCFDAFEDYVGLDYDDSDFDYGFFAPDEAEWDAGDRRVVCVVLPYTEDDLVGSVRGSRR